MTKRKDASPEALEASGAAAEGEGRRKVAEALATLIESRYTPHRLYNYLCDHVIEISEETFLYIFAPEVVRAVYPLMCERAEALEAERQREERRVKRGRRGARAAKGKAEPPATETDSVN